MGAMICPRCGTPLYTVTGGVVYVRCGHRPVSAVQPPRSELLHAYERWSYGEGWTDGLADGRQRGFDEGFRAGFEAGVDAHHLSAARREHLPVGVASRSLGRGAAR